MGHSGKFAERDLPDYSARNFEERGFTDITVEERSIPLGSWAGVRGCQARDNYLDVFRGMKTPVLRAGGLGFIKSEEEYDDMIAELEKEWDTTEGASIEFFIIYAKKPE